MPIPIELLSKSFEQRVEFFQSRARAFLEANRGLAFEYGEIVTGLGIGTLGLVGGDRGYGGRYWSELSVALTNLVRDGVVQETNVYSSWNVYHFVQPIGKETRL